MLHVLVVSLMILTASHFSQHENTNPVKKICSQKQPSRYRCSLDVQTPWGLTGKTWLQAGAQRVVIAVDPQLNSLGIDSRNDIESTWFH